MFEEGGRRWHTTELTSHASSFAPRAPRPQVIAYTFSSTIVVFDICYQVVLALFRTLPGRCPRSLCKRFLACDVYSLWRGVG
jgi:hypothetical protein